MAQTVPATAVLGPGLTGLTIGLRVLNLDGTEYAAFSAVGVAETNVLGTYRKASGVSVPDAGGYIVWGTAGTDYAEATVDAVTPAVAISASTAASISTGALAIRSHHTLAQAITSTYSGNLGAATKLWLAIKANRTDADAKAVVFIEATAGLTVLAGAPYITVAHGTLVVTGNAGAWTVTVGMDEIATGLLTDYAESMLWAECKALVGGSTVAVWDGVCDVSHGLVVAVA